MTYADTLKPARFDYFFDNLDWEYTVVKAERGDRDTPGQPAHVLVQGIWDAEGNDLLGVFSQSYIEQVQDYLLETM